MALLEAGKGYRRRAQPARTRQNQGVPRNPSPTARRAAARCLLEDLQEAGFDRFPRRQRRDAPTDLGARIEACRACPRGAQRGCAVPGEGAMPAALMCVGEGPGAQEDASGRPFVGPAGQLLDRILLQGMGLRREEVFIANLVKCRPPGNRDPLPEEVAACAPFLQEQLAQVRPRVILALGRHAAQHLLGREEALERLRGRLHPLPGHPHTQVVVTYHPAYLLRNPAAKRDTWQDVQIAMRELGLASPAAGSSNPGNPAPDRD